MQCSIGIYLQEACESATELVVQSIKDKFNEDEELMLKLRTDDRITTICQKHELKYLVNYSHYFGKKCYDPFNFHSTVISKTLRDITLKLETDVKFIKLIPAKRLCARCRNKIYQKRKEIDDDGDPNDQDPTFEPPEEMNVVESLSSLGLNPVKVRKLNHDQRASVVENAITQSAISIQDDLNKSFGIHLASVTLEDSLWAN